MKNSFKVVVVALAIAVSTSAFVPSTRVSLVGRVATDKHIDDSHKFALG